MGAVMKERDRLRWGARDGEHLELLTRARAPGRVGLNTEAFRGTDQNARWQRLLGRPASKSGRLCRGDGPDELGDRLRRSFVLPIFQTLSRIISFWSTGFGLRKVSMYRELIRPTTAGLLTPALS